MHDPKDLKDAVQRLSRGATVGMVDAELARKGVPSGPRDEVLEFAKRIANRRFRLKHIAIALLGGLILIAGPIWIYHNIQNGIRILQVPGSLAFAGFLAVIYGLYFSVRNRV